MSAGTGKHGGRAWLLAMAVRLSRQTAKTAKWLLQLNNESLLSHPLSSEAQRRSLVAAAMAQWVKKGSCQAYFTRSEPGAKVAKPSLSSVPIAPLMVQLVGNTDLNGHLAILWELNMGSILKPVSVTK